MENSSKSPRNLAQLLVLGTRPRTLPAAIVPVCVGVASVENFDSSMWWKAVLAATVSVSLQVAVNYANDYSDGIKGTDDQRIGPLRLVGSGLVQPRIVKRAAFAMLAVAGISGLILALSSSLWILLIGFFAMLAAWTYTGGPRPYGYAGLGEVFVFVFFGIVATVGTQYVVSQSITALSVVASVGVGALSCALLVVNNLRDRQGDQAVGKNTLAVKMGDRWTRYFFSSLFVAAAVAVLVVSVMAQFWALIGLVGLVFAVPGIKLVLAGAQGTALIKVLEQVGKAQIVFGLTFSLGIFLSIQ